MSPFPSYLLSKRNHRAFSMIEFLIVLTLISSVGVLTVPALAQWAMRMRIDWTVQALIAAMAYARTESVRRSMPVTLCRSGEYEACSGVARRCAGYRTAHNEWHCGWSIVVGHRKWMRTANGADAVLRHTDAVKGVSIIARGNVNALTFRPPAGQATGAAGNLEIGPFIPAQSRGGSPSDGTTYRRCIRIGMSGRPVVESASCR